MKIGIRADGGENIGMGHIQRCLALAFELKKRKVEVIFITKRNEIIKERIEAKGFKVVELRDYLNLREDLGFTIDFSKKLNIETLITDSYKFDEDYLKELKKNVSFLVSIDDLCKFPFPSDIVINQNIYAKELNCRSSNGETEFLLGPKYALLGEEFSKIKQKQIKEKVDNILITFGGGDYFNLTPKVLETIDEISGSLEINVAIGPFSKNIDEIKNLSKKIKKKLNLIFNCSNMTKLMFSADLAITAGGTTLYELASTGTPAIAICMAENQMKNIKAMEKLGTIIDAGWGGNFSPKDFREKLKTLIEDFSLRGEMSKKGQKLVDGKGSLRCAEKILQR